MVVRDLDMGQNFVIFDQPTSGLDPLVQNKIMEYTGEILNIQKDSSDKETFEYMLKKNGFSSLF